MARASRSTGLRQFALRLVAVLAVGWLASLACIAGWARRTSHGPADAIVVLGAAQYGGRPSPVLRSRLDHALSLWKSAEAPRIVVTGGRRQGDLISEAAAGRRYLARRGVPNAAILLEPAGRTSLASIEGAASVLSALRDSTPPGRAGRLPDRPRVLVVSDPFHMLRLDILARLHGLQPLPSPTRTSPISANRAVLEYMLRESVALPTDVALLVWLRITGKRLVDA
jgi:uncharacterized SAM-binding protein YcdF (DUF218 family)